MALIHNYPAEFETFWALVPTAREKVKVAKAYMKAIDWLDRPYPGRDNHAYLTRRYRLWLETPAAGNGSARRFLARKIYLERASSWWPSAWQ